MIQSYSVEGHTLFSRTDNPGASGMPIILLHGVMSSLPFWTPELVEPFLPYGPCTALTLPGHYPAVFPPDFDIHSFTAGWMARVLHTTIQAITGGQPALIVGHSTGGYAALELAVFYPQAVRGLISVAGFAQGRWKGWLRAYQWLASSRFTGPAAFWALQKLGSWRKLFHLTAAYHTPIPAGQISKSDMNHLIDENFDAYRHFDRNAMQTYFSAMLDIDITPRLKEIQVPVLALCGQHDPAVSPSQSKRIAAEIPGAELVIIPGNVGHMPFYQRAQVYRQAVDGWLSRHYQEAVEYPSQ